MIPCDRCDLPLDPDLAHWDHKDEDCPRSDHGESTCDCDLSVHPECCHACLPMLAHKNTRCV